MTKNSTKNMLAALALLALPTAVSAAPVLYGMDYGGPAPLQSIDTGSGAATSAGGPDIEGIGDLTSNLTDTIWGVDLFSSTNDLVTIDPLTGMVTNTVAMTGTREGDITSLAWNPLTGTLYGNTAFNDSDSSNDDLYTIDPVTGNVTYVGRINYDNVFALAFDNLGALWGISDTTGDLITLDLGSGNGTLEASSIGSGLFDLAFDPVTGTAYVSDALGDNLGILDTGTGGITNVGAYGGVASHTDNIAGLAFINDVPEPGTLAILGSGLLLLSLQRRRA